MLTTTNPAVALSAAERGLGLGFFPWQLAGVRSPLVRVLEGTVGSSRDLYLVAGLRQRESPRVQLGQQIMDWMQSVWVDLPERSNR
jgi:DNA-binding transcriptional LysR family regulator